MGFTESGEGVGFTESGEGVGFPEGGEGAGGLGVQTHPSFSLICLINDICPHQNIKSKNDRYKALD